MKSFGRLTGFPSICPGLHRGGTSGGPKVQGERGTRDVTYVVYGRVETRTVDLMGRGKVKTFRRGVKFLVEGVLRKD